MAIHTRDRIMQNAAGQDNGRAQDREILEDLNRNYVRSAEQSDVRWYSENLAEDFLSSSVDGSIIDRMAFLTRMARPYPGSNLEAVDVRIRFFGELALVHAGFKYRKPDGQMGSGRYTDTYARRQGRWLCVSAHFNRF
jgi:ketosteroid isomerase-like protein